MKILLGLLVIFTLGYGYFYLGFDPATVEETSIESASQNIALVPVLVSPKITAGKEQGLRTSEFINNELGFSFIYRVNPDAYSVVLQPTAGASYQNLLAMYSVMKTSDYNKIIQDSAKGIYYGSPTAIGVQVYDAGGAININTWLLDNSISTNCEVETIFVTTVDGKDTSGCNWSGMYEGITVALLHKNRVYMLTGERDENISAYKYSNYSDFNELVSSFRVY